ncbi:nucleotidyltransferase family protein [Thiomicrospira sp. ALE5]|uniref:nucleotidyltransferase family protein n=1 Tax=Thiomicrospira sp. ALE5 TaxID=748650 RepID=UPI000B877E0C|nr:nucleotidyltransferase family protein [Thiomicrospira sp. ALE5]
MMITILDNITVRLNDSLRTVLKVLDVSSMQFVVVVDDNLRVCGTITDGDIRRALLSGATLDLDSSLFMNPKPTCGLENKNEAAWRALMHSKGLRHLPIVDGNGILIGLFYDKPARIEKLRNPVVLMLGGKGLRLRPLTENIPKPMLNVGGKPILETIVNQLVEQGFYKFYFCINYLGDQIKAYFGNGDRWGVDIQYIEEGSSLGTAGALALLPDVTDDFIVMNGDLLTKVDFVSLLSFHLAHNNVVTACVREYSQQIPYGVVEFTDSKVTQIIEKPLQRYFVNAGIYALSPASLNQVSINGYYDMPAMMNDLLDQNCAVGGFPLTEYWMDIGKMPDYEQAQVDYGLHFHSEEFNDE